MKNFKIAFLLILAILIVSGCSINYYKNTTPLGNTTDNQGNTGNNSDGQSTGTTPTPSGKKLDLSNQGLTKVPMDIFDRVELVELDLSGNRLTGALPSQIGKLKNLEILDASNNLMTGVPAELGQLSKLREINYANNQLTGLPNELGNLTNLRVLNLTGNAYSQQDMAQIKAKLPNLQVIQ